MFLFFLLLCGFAAADEANKNYNRGRKYCRKSYRRYREDKSWLDAAWFHDHGYNIL